MNVTVSTVASIACWFIEKTLGKLVEHRFETFLSRVDLEEEVPKRLELQMQLIKLDLNIVSGTQIRNEGLGKAVEEVWQLASTAEDLLDELHYYELREQVQGTQTDGQPRAGAKRSRCNFLGLFVQRPSRQPEDDIHRRMVQVVEDLEKIAGVVRRHLHMDAPHSSSNALEGTTESTFRQTHSFPCHRVFGRDTVTEHIVELLTGEYSHHCLSVLPIVGIGGIGKTTLARVVYKHERVDSHFDLRIWISMSVDFDEVGIVRQMLEYATAGARYEGIKNLNKLYELLLYHLQFKRFLLILDGMWWDKGTQSWDNVLAPLRCTNVEGNVILVTTRKLSVARVVSEEEPIHLKGIEENEYWSFFRECAFSNETQMNLEMFEGIGREIATRLQGHPLAAKSVGALLKSKSNVGDWKRILENREWKRLQTEEDIIPSLRLSYEHLPIHLQRCFAICSLFPKNYKFHAEDLFRIWAAQDLLSSKSSPEQLRNPEPFYHQRLSKSRVPSQKKLSNICNLSPWENWKRLLNLLIACKFALSFFAEELMNLYLYKHSVASKQDSIALARTFHVYAAERAVDKQNKHDIFIEECESLFGTLQPS